jgi:hypothetical protein
MTDSRYPLNLIGGGFSHSPSSSGFEPEFITWIKNGESSDISIYVDESIIKETNPNKKNYGWICESKTIKPKIYEWALDNIELLKSKFITVFTHDLELTKKSEVFTLTQCSSKSFLDKHEVYPKTKLCSIVSSSKNYCKEHQFRLDIIKKYSHRCDLYGRGFKEIPDKLLGLKDYCFSFAMENATYSNMFTEKITDCFVTGTIPIYHGISNIGEFFNIDGIIVLDDNFDFDSLSFDLYHSKKNAIKENFDIATKMLSAEDFIFNKFIKHGI